jgi:hypothetical protein
MGVGGMAGFTGVGEAAGELEEVSGGDAGFEGVVGPFRQRMGDRFVQVEESVGQGGDGEDTGEAFCATGDGEGEVGGGV